jgi:glutaminase
VTDVALSPLMQILERIHLDLAGDTRGEVATYIPELGLADPRLFGIAVAMVDGQVFEMGDARELFSIQSISKPLVFGMALEERGADIVLDHIGIEPSGNAFNSITFDPVNNRPYNPMVNAGAIVTTSLIVEADPDDDVDRVREIVSRFAGRDLAIDERVFESERKTGDRNRALAWLMRSFGALHADVEEVIDLYFAQCSILANCRDLAVMGATLANDGMNPVTGQRAISAEHVTKVLSIMATCGMYDQSGEWVYRVGLPAKSGVAGGVLAVLPGQLGIGVYSPRVDARGNSIRGVEVCERLSEELQLHLLGPTSGAQSVVRRVARGDDYGSNRVRTIAEDEAIASTRRSIAIFELQGELVFVTAERAYRSVVTGLDGVEFVVLDFTRVTAVDAPALAVISDLTDALTAAGCTVLAINDGVCPKLVEAVTAFVDVDAALEWCEDRLLEAAGFASQVVAGQALARFDLLQGLSDAELAAVERLAVRRTLDAGATVFREGDRADELLFLLGGRVSVVLPLGENADDRVRRLATFGPGVALGEMALLDDQTRSADVVCDEDSTVAALSLDGLRGLDAEHPGVRHTLDANLARLLARRLRTANAQIRALSR